jgi:hypothetical protein
MQICMGTLLNCKRNRCNTASDRHFPFPNHCINNKTSIFPALSMHSMNQSCSYNVVYGRCKTFLHPSICLPVTLPKTKNVTLVLRRCLIAPGSIMHAFTKIECLSRHQGVALSKLDV